MSAGRGMNHHSFCFVDNDNIAVLKDNVEGNVLLGGNVAWLQEPGRLDKDQVAVLCSDRGFGRRSVNLHRADGDKPLELRAGDVRHLVREKDIDSRRLSSSLADQETPARYRRFRRYLEVIVFVTAGTAVIWFGHSGYTGTDGVKGASVHGIGLAVLVRKRFDGDIAAYARIDHIQPRGDKTREEG